MSDSHGVLIKTADGQTALDTRTIVWNYVGMVEASANQSTTLHSFPHAAILSDFEEQQYVVNALPTDQELQMHTCSFSGANLHVGGGNCDAFILVFGR